MPIGVRAPTSSVSSPSEPRFAVPLPIDSPRAVSEGAVKVDAGSCRHQMDHAIVIILQIAQEIRQHGRGSRLWVVKQDDALAGDVEPVDDQLQFMLRRHRKEAIRVRREYLRQWSDLGDGIIQSEDECLDLVDRDAECRNRFGFRCL